MTTETTDLRAWAHDEDHTSQQRNKATLWGLASVLFVAALVVLFGTLDKAVGGGSTTGFMIKNSHRETGKSPYKATQFISFSINTMGGIAEHGECVGRDVAADGTCYLGSFDIAEDVDHRALIVGGVLEMLKNDKDRKHPNVDHRDDGKHIVNGAALHYLSVHIILTVIVSSQSAQDLRSSRILLERSIWCL